jgi:hypothetical protein
VCDEFTLDLGNQITVAFVYHKANWTTTPSTALIEVGKPFTMITIVGIEYYEWATV